MAVPQPANDMPAYVIYRDIQPGEPFDPTSPLLFFPPKGSDELFYALRLAYPNVDSHSKRMREAVIQYLLEERHEEQSQQTSPAMTVDNAFPSVSSGSTASLLSSPDTVNMSTPASFAPSPQPQSSHWTRHTSSAATTTTSSQPSPPAIDQMTSVFSLSTSNQPKQRVRRKMTEAEKAEYRKRRIVKACDKCAKRKRKCPHNQAEMETVISTASKSSSRVSKSASPKSTKSPPSMEQQVVFDPNIFSAQDVDFADAFNINDFAPTEDFDLYAESFPELDMNDVFDLDQFCPTNEYQPTDVFTPDVSQAQKDWQFDQTEDFTLLDPTFSTSLTADEMSWFSQASPSFGMYGGSSGLGRRMLLPFDNATRTSIQSGDSMTSSTDSLSSAGSYFRQDSRSENLQGTTRVTDQSRGIGQPNSTEVETFGARSTARGTTASDGSGSIVLWKHLRTGQEDTARDSGNAYLSERLRSGQPEKPVPTHTAHVHDTECGGPNGLNDAAHTANCSTLSETVLRLTGTKRAIKTFGGILNRHTPSVSAVTMEDVANVLKQHTDGIEHDAQRRRHPVSGHRPLYDTASLYDVNKRESRIPDSDTIWQERRSRSDQRVSSHGQGLTSTSVSSSSGSRSAALQGRLLSSSPSRHAIQSQPSLHAQEYERGVASLGEGLPEHADATTQLYMARKRVSSNLRPMVGRNVNARLQINRELATNPLLLTRSAHGLSEGLRLPGDAVLQLATTSAANGGAYPRLAEVASPVSPSPSPASLQQTTTVTAATVAPVSETRLVEHVRHQDQLGLPGATHEERLRDTNRHKDHHGRSQQEQPQLSTYLLAMFGCALLLQAANVFSAATTTSAALLLAATLIVVPPQQHGKTTSTPSLEKIVHCTTPNSRWLSLLTASLFSEEGTEHSRPAALRSPRNSSGEKDSHRLSCKMRESGARAWLRSLMDPHALAAPVRFAC